MHELETIGPLEVDAILIQQLIMVSFVSVCSLIYIDGLQQFALFYLPFYF